jgi:hypothetical protein
MRQKYLKVWEGTVQNSLDCRDDGYPETKLLLIDTEEKLIRHYTEAATFYKLEQVNLKEAVEILKSL